MLCLFKLFDLFIHLNLSFNYNIVAMIANKQNLEPNFAQPPHKIEKDLHRVKIKTKLYTVKKQSIAEFALSPKRNIVITCFQIQVKEAEK